MTGFDQCRQGYRLVSVALGRYVKDDDPLGRVYLGCGQADTGRIEHRIDHVGDQPVNGRIGRILDRIGDTGENRMAHSGDLQYGHIEPAIFRQIRASHRRGDVLEGAPYGGRWGGLHH